MRGFAFTLVFVLIAALLVLTAVEALRWKRGEPTFADVGKRAYIADDVAQDILGILDVSISASRNGTHALLSFSDSIPSRLSAPDASMAEYVGFIERRYANLTNSNITVGGLEPLLRFSAPEFAYRYSGWDKRGVGLVGDADSYSITLVLDRECEGRGGGGRRRCEPEGPWNWTSKGTFVELDIRDSRGQRVEPGGRSSGYIDKEQFNAFTVALRGGGMLTVTVGGDAFRIFVDNAGAELESEVAVRHEGGIRAEVPVEVTVDGTTFAGVPVLEK